MTTSKIGGSSPTPPWYARPGVVLSLLGGLVLITALLARGNVSGRNGDPRLSSYSTEPLGARLLFELAGKLGLVAARETRGVVPTGTNAIYAVLDPVIALNKNDVHNILNFVRAGGALLVVLGSGTSVVSDSLAIDSYGFSGTVVTKEGARRACETSSRFNTEGLWFGQSATLMGLKGAALSSMHPVIFASVATNRDSASGARTRTPYRTLPAVIGFAYGAGRVVVASDPDVYRNDALRDCPQSLDIAAVHALEYLQAGVAGTRNRIVFDEYRQGRSAGIVGLITQYMRGTPSGHAVLQLCIAGLLLMMAAATRTLPPRDEGDIVERRSPLEHVDALARAYAQVGATRTAVLRLASGLQRRVERGAARSARRGTADSSDLFLARIADTKPTLVSDVQMVREALNNSVSTARFKAVGQAIERIEDALTRT
ncbi:MAG: DUF4350 domain-containing protein [Gemmatimonadota bacterium]|nr:DUF4350 domain-containing protein [Gemmatimonadota bacterium]